MAELSVNAQTPSVHEALFVHECRVFFAAREVDNFTNSLCQSYSLRRIDFILPPNYAQLTVIVASKHEKLAVLVQNHSELSACLYFCNVLQTLDFFW